MVKIISVAAVAQNGVIGVRSENEMPWRLGQYKKDPFWDNMKDENSFRPIDMAKFQDMTIGKDYAVLMGKKTWESIPSFAKPLRGRENLVLSTTMPEQEGIKVYRSFDEALKTFSQYEQVAAMGGVSIYEHMNPLADMLFITRLHKDFKGDVYFPTIDDTVWELADVEPQLAGRNHTGKFSFETYLRK